MVRLSQLVAAHRRYAEESRQTRAEVENTLLYPTGKVSDMPIDHKWLVLGYRHLNATTAPRVVLYEATTDDNSVPDTACVWATQGLGKVLEGCADAFESRADKYRRTTFWLPPGGISLSSRRQNALAAGDRDRPSQSIPVEGRPQNLLEPIRY